TAALAKATCLTLTASLVDMNLPRRRQMGTSALDHRTVFVTRHDALLYDFLHHIHFPGRQKIAVGHSVYAVFIAGYACEVLHITVPRCNIRIADRPIHGKSVPGGTFKIILRPALGLPGPEQRLAAHLIGT